MVLYALDPTTRQLTGMQADTPPERAVEIDTAALVGLAPGLRFLQADGTIVVQPDPTLVAAAADRTRRQQLVAALQTDLATVQGSGNLTLALVKPILAHLIQAVLAIATLLPERGID